MTKGEAVNALYAVFNAPHNADINISYLNKILDDLVAAEREECAKVCEEVAEEYRGTAKRCAAAIRSRT